MFNFLLQLFSSKNRLSSSFLVCLRDGMVDITDLKSVGFLTLAGSSPAVGTTSISFDY